MRTTTLYCLLLAAVFAGAVALSAAPSFAKGYSGGNNNNGGSPPPTIPPVDRSQSIRARKDVDAAGREVGKANSAAAAIAAKVRKEYEQSAEGASGLANLKAAQTELDTDRAAVLKSLSANAAYQSAKAEKTKVEADRDAVRDDASASPEDRVRAATSVMEAGKAVTKLETDALASDPKIAAAQSKLAAASASWNEALKKIDATLKDNADWQAAMKVVDDKKQVLAAAQKTLSDALAQEAQAERTRQAQISRG